MIGGSSGHLERKQLARVQRADRAIGTNGAVEQNLVAMKIRISEDAAIFVLDWTRLAVLKRCNCELYRLQVHAILAATTKRCMPIKKGNRRFTGAMLRIFDGRPGLAVGERVGD